MGVTKDHGERQVLDEELEIAVPPIEGVLPAPLVFRAIESDPIERSFDTFDTPDGEAHSAGRSRSSKELQLTVLAANSATLTLLEAWYEAAKHGMPGSKPTVTSTKYYGSGDPGRSREMLRCFPRVIRDSGTGTSQASNVQIVLKYKDSEPVIS